MVLYEESHKIEQKGGKDMSLRLAQILYKLFHITTTVKDGQVRHGIEFLK